MNSRLRGAKTRREVHYGWRTPTSWAEATATGAGDLAGSAAASIADADLDHYPVDDHEPGQIVRIKEHPAVPMTVDLSLIHI